MNNIAKGLWILLIVLFQFHINIAEDPVEVVKAVSPENIGGSDEESDQVALESNDQESPPAVLLPQLSHVPPAALAVNRANMAIGQPFAPPPAPHMSYHGPPPPPPPHLRKPLLPQPPPKDMAYAAASEKQLAIASNELWALPVTDTPKIISLDVKCEKNGMKVFLQFDKPFFGIVFSKGHYSNINCVHLPAGLGRASATFEIAIHACGTSGNTENGMYGYGHESGSGTYFENIIVIQYDPQVQEVWDQARKLRCTWHDQYEKSVT